MRTRSFHRLTLLAVAAVALTATACGSKPARAGPDTPVGVTAPPATTSTTPTSTTAPSTDTSPATTPRAPNQSSCLGAVIHTINAPDGGPPWPSLCMAVGGLLRFEYLGPGYLNAVSWDKVDCDYEGGVHECRLIHTGTVRFTVTNSHGARPFTLVVAPAASPPKPSPACTATAPYRYDAAGGGPEWRALCLKIGAVLVVENLGPEGFTATPGNLLSCRYEAAVRTCTFVKAGTVTFTIQHSPEWETRTLHVVVIR
jgi:hypothetical protein